MEYEGLTLQVCICDLETRIPQHYQQFAVPATKSSWGFRKVVALKGLRYMPSK